MAKQAITGNLNALKALIDPFGWSIDPNSVRQTQASSLRTIQEWCEDESAESEPCPGSLWRLIDVPYERRKAFKDDNDVRALLFELFAYRADFLELAKNPDGWMLILADNISQGDGASKYGSVFFDDYQGKMAVWFGKKDKMLPWMAGETLRSAMSLLLDPKSVPAEPTPATAATPKSTNRRTLASPPPAASVSGPGLSKKTRMVARKESEASENVGSSRGAVTATLATIQLSHLVADPKNHRKTFEKTALQELTESIKQHGVLQPLLVRPLNPGSEFYVIIAGERRYRAAMAAGKTEVPVQIVERDGLQGSLAMLEENIRREDLSPIERAQAIAALIETHELTQAEVGKMIGCTQAQISNELRLLNLPEKLHSKIGDGEGQIAATTIRPALPFADVPAVVEAIEEMLKDGGPFTSKDVECYLETAIHKAGRSMRFNEQRSNYSAPKKTERHFKELSAEDRAELQIRKYDGEEFAFNVAKFDELNREPLKKRIESHKKATKVSSTPATPKDKTVKLIQEFKEYQLKRLIHEQLAVELETIIIGSKDSHNVLRAIWALAICGELKELCGNHYDHPEKYYKTLSDLLADPKQTVGKIQPKLRGQLEPRHRNIETLHFVAELMTVRLGSNWRPTTKILELLTDAGLEACRVAIFCDATQKGKQLIARLVKEWPAGTMPSFLEALFEYPKAPAKKRTKAA
jgi:ParB/RepB/Spo0J family partition protein